MQSLFSICKTLFLVTSLCTLFQKTSLAQAGSLDPSFGTGGIVKTNINNGNDYGYGITQQTDGKILVAGIARIGTANNNFGVMRYELNGVLDTTFGGDGIVTTDIIPGADDAALSIRLQSDGKIVVGGRSAVSGGTYNFAVTRYLTDGTIDSTFNTDGIVTTDIAGFNDYGSSLNIQADGRIVLAGYSYNGTVTSMAVVRYTTNGYLDTSFDTDGIVTTQVGNLYLDGQAAAIQNDGKIVVTGTTNYTGTGKDVVVIRYNADGSLDTSFDTDGIVISDIGYDDFSNSIAIQNDGKIVIGGSTLDTSTTSYNRNFLVVRYNIDGSLDNSFGGDGSISTEIVNHVTDRIFGLTLQNDGKIVAVGHNTNGVNFSIALARYNTDGSLDNGFGNNGVLTTDIATEEEYGQSVCIQSDGNILITGSVKSGGSFDIFVARYNGNAPLKIEEYSRSMMYVYPNPFSFKSNIQTDFMLQNATMYVYNVYGEKVKEIRNLSGQSISFDREKLPAGLYIFTLSENNKVVVKGKMLIAD